MYHKGPFKNYVSKEVGVWGQKVTPFADLQYYLCWRRWVGGGPKKAQNTKKLERSLIVMVVQIYFPTLQSRIKQCKSYFF